MALEGGTGEPPRSARPYMPGYGIARSPRGLLSWDWAERQLTLARNYWVVTASPPGRPHLMPVWGVWLAGALYFSTGERSRKARNLLRNPECVIAPEDATTPVVVEGRARRVTEAELLRRFVESYAHKYAWPMEATPEGVHDAEGNVGAVFEVRPRVAFGIGTDFRGSATRWRFE
jgi:hypothetical protein